MKKPKQKFSKILFLAMTTAIISGGLLLNSFITNAESTDDTLEDLSLDKPLYTESTNPLHNNPERGFYRTATLHLKESGNSAINPKSETSNLLWLQVDISDFSGAQRADGTDIELTNDAIIALNGTLDNIKNNNQSAILRFVYDKDGDGIKDTEGKLDSNGNRYVEPNIDMIKKHISSLSATFKKYKNTIFLIQIGFFGDYGELHGSPMATQANFNQVLDAMLDNTDENTYIAVRTPSQMLGYYNYLNSTNYQISDLNMIYGDELESNSSQTTTTKAQKDSKSNKMWRVGFYDDGYLGSESDLGTYTDRENEIADLVGWNVPNPFGGEAVINDDSALAIAGLTYINKYSQIKNLEDEASALSTDYLNYEWNQKLLNEWKGIKYSGAASEFQNLTNLDGTDYSDYDFVDAHLGYRFVLKNSTISVSGNIASVTYPYLNYGFSQVKSDKYKETLILADENGNIKKVFDAPSVVRDAIGSTIMTETMAQNAEDYVGNNPVSLDLSDISTGTYRLYLRIATDETLSDGTPYLPIQFANQKIWNDSLKANFLGSFTYNGTSTTATTTTSDETPDVIPDTSGRGKSSISAVSTNDILLIIFASSIAISAFLFSRAYLVRKKVGFKIKK